MGLNKGWANTVSQRQPTFSPNERKIRLAWHARKWRRDNWDWFGPKKAEGQRQRRARNKIKTMRQRFKSEQEVVDRIDSYRKDTVIANKEMVELEHLIVQLRTTCESNRIGSIRARITSLSNEVAWREGRLNTLKEILAEFRTTPIPGFIDGDTSVTSP